MTKSKSKQFTPAQNKLAQYAHALSHPARLAILDVLAKRETCICGEIVEVLPLAQSTVSQHLKVLKEVGLIKGEIAGLTSCYCLDPDAFNELEELWNGLTRELKRGLRKRCC